MAATTAAFSSSGTTLNVTASAPATYDAAGYAALTWTAGDIGEVVNIGDLVESWGVISHNTVNTRKTRKLKGNQDLGTLNLSLAYAPGDEGQAIMRAAYDSDNAYSFRMTLPDGTKIYFSGIVTSHGISVGGGEQITGAPYTVELTKELIEVDPA